MIRRVLYEVGRAFRETGQQLDRVGLRVVDKPIFKEPCKLPFHHHCNTVV